MTRQQQIDLKRSEIILFAEGLRNGNFDDALTLLQDSIKDYEMLIWLSEQKEKLQDLTKSA